MKLISVQSWGDRLVKVWQLNAEIHRGVKKLFKAARRKLCERGRAYDITMHKTEKLAIKAAAEWLEGATV